MSLLAMLSGTARESEPHRVVVFFARPARYWPPIWTLVPYWSCSFCFSAKPVFAPLAPKGFQCQMVLKVSTAGSEGFQQRSCKGSRLQGSQVSQIDSKAKVPKVPSGKAPRVPNAKVAKVPTKKVPAVPKPKCFQNLEPCSRTLEPYLQHFETWLGNPTWSNLTSELYFDLGILLENLGTWLRHLLWELGNLCWEPWNLSEEPDPEAWKPYLIENLKILPRKFGMLPEKPWNLALKTWHCARF